MADHRSKLLEIHRDLKESFKNLESLITNRQNLDGLTELNATFLPLVEELHDNLAAATMNELTTKGLPEN